MSLPTLLIGYRQIHTNEPPYYPLTVLPYPSYPTLVHSPNLPCIITIPSGTDGYDSEIDDLNPYPALIYTTTLYYPTLTLPYPNLPCIVTIPSYFRRRWLRQ